MLLSPEREEGEQAEQGGGGAGDGLIGPLALGLDAEMAADLGEGNLDAPATNEPAQDVARIGREIGAQEGVSLGAEHEAVDATPGDLPPRLAGGPEIALEFAPRYCSDPLRPRRQ